MNLYVAQRKKILQIISMSIAAFLGAALGIGSYTFGYANGASYFSDRPEACANCHVMREVLQDWRSGDHHHVAVCNDCHVPQGPIAKWITKGINGLHHSYAFTLTETPAVIRAMALSRETVQENCLRCHGQIFADHEMSEDHHNDPALPTPPNRCISCHRQVGHLH